MNVLTTAGALLLSGVPSLDRAPAEALPREFVPADARLVFHVDCDALRATTLWKVVMSESGPLSGELDDLEEIQVELGIDPFQDVKSVTLYGTEVGADPTAVLLVVNKSLDRAIDALRDRHGLRTIRAEGLDLYALDEDDETIVAHVAELPGGDRLIVLSDSVEKTSRAVRVVRGDLPSLADDAGARLQARPGHGSFLYGELAGGLPEELQPASQVFGLAQGIQFDFGEAGGSLFVHASLATESDEDAMDVADTVDGLLALARLAADEIPPEAKNLLRALRVNTRGSLVTVDFEYDVHSLLSIVESMEGHAHHEGDVREY